jgi:hypothetical protein
VNANGRILTDLLLLLHPSTGLPPSMIGVRLDSPQVKISAPKRSASVDVKISECLVAWVA